MKKTISVLLTLLVLFCGNAAAQDDSVALREVLNEFRARYNAVNDFSADVQQVLNKGTNHESVITGTMIYKRPNRYKIEYSSPYSLIIKCDGHKSVVENLDTGEDFTEDIVEGSYDFLSMSAKIAQLEKYHEIEEVKTLQRDGKTLLGVSLLGKAGDDSKKRVRVIFDASTGLMYKYLYKTYGLDDDSGDVYYHTVSIEYQQVDGTYIVGRIIHTVFFYEEIYDQGQGSSEPVTVISETSYENVEVNTGISLRAIVGD